MIGEEERGDKKRGGEEEGRRQERRKGNRGEETDVEQGLKVVRRGEEE